MSVTKKPSTAQEILDKLDIPFTSGYRKISSLVQDGILVESRILKKRYYKKIMEYTTILESVKVELVNGNRTVFIKIKSI